MPNQLCKLCGQWLSQGMPDWTKHVLSEVHQKKVQQLEQSKQEEEASIFVTGWSHLENFELDQLVTCLSGFGKIKKYFLGRGNNYGIFTFQAKADALKVLNSPVEIENTKLIVRPRLRKKNQDGSLEDLMPMPDLPTQFIIPNEGSWENQADHLARMMGMQGAPPNPWEIPKLDHVGRDIKRALHRCFPNCKISIFGSTMTGLAGPDSDIDVFVDLSPDFEQMSEVRKTQRLQNPAKFQEEIITHCRNFLSQSPAFQNLFAIPRARTPLIKCVHRATQLQLDINFKNYLCVMNTELLKYYFELDHRVKKLVIVLKYFLKVQNLTFSSYSFSFMVLFFLMRLEKPIVPPVKDLLIRETCNISDLPEEMWKIQFQKLKFKTENRQGLKELLVEFFHFLRTFNYGIDVMCPLTGETMPRWKFLQVETLPAAMAKLQLAMEHKQQSFPAQKSAIAVQDPLELVHNITKNITAKHLNEFVELCKAAEEHCRSEESLNGLMCIKPKPPVCSGTSQHCIELFCYDYFPPLAKLQAGEDITKIWFTHTKEVIEDIFSYVYHFEDVSDNNGTSSPPHKLPKVALTVWSQFKEMQTKFCLWNSRKRGKNEPSPGATPKTAFAQEVGVSTKLLQLFYKNTASLSPIIHIQVKLTQHQAPCRICLEILDVSSEKTLLFNFINFLSGNLQSLLNKGLSENYKAELDMRSAEDIVKQAVAQSDLKETSGQSFDAQAVLLGTLKKLSAEDKLKQKQSKSDVPNEKTEKKQSVDAQTLLMSSLSRVAGSSSSSVKTTITSGEEETLSDSLSQSHCERKKLTKEEKSPLRFLLKQAEGQKSTPEPPPTGPAPFKFSNTRSSAPSQPSRFGPNKRRRSVQKQKQDSADRPVQPVVE